MIQQERNDKRLISSRAAGAHQNGCLLLRYYVTGAGTVTRNVQSVIMGSL
jgi:hypothetical protein